ncbi:TIGR03862 family flavoprotein [uncultured Thiothrix sp.]|uniref:NAD(P)/FAD-dependent oxidoreductase n=1 Tax=uncultured Thiothrix sp. TaxID=223185 RepID=UPI0026300A7D|nr:TIGR03862 family flavoprotein [uncultured Thiothrix sp.]HMT93451.1 TIGR03862 family flavoprotein [Thiolinea sp.]
MNQQPILAAVIGGGPAGLMAAEQLTQAGFAVDLYDAMPSVGRKFLLAGIGGLNLTHSENFANFITRYAERAAELTPYLQAFSTDALRQWCTELGIETFIGSSGRVFPKEMKAAPLLRAWLSRLKHQGLTIYPRHCCLGLNAAQEWRLQTPAGVMTKHYPVSILALGGASWKKLGSDGAWVDWLAEQQIAIKPLRPANNGFLCAWSAYLKPLAGLPLKPVSLSFTDLSGHTETRQGELIVTEQGVEGSLIYAFAARLRDCLEQRGCASFYLDLCPHQTQTQLEAVLKKRSSKKSLGSFLKSQLKLDTLKTALIFEKLDKTRAPTADYLAQLLKNLPITVIGMTPLDEAISTAGGIDFSALTPDLMLKDLPGVFCAGEMLDWEAPTGGYLLTACLATGKQAGLGAVRYLQNLAATQK